MKKLSPAEYETLLFFAGQRVVMGGCDCTPNIGKRMLSDVSLDSAVVKVLVASNHLTKHPCRLHDRYHHFAITQLGRAAIVAYEFCRRMEI